MELDGMEQIDSIQGKKALKSMLQQLCNMDYLENVISGYATIDFEYDISSML